MLVPPPSETGGFYPSPPQKKIKKISYFLHSFCQIAHEIHMLKKSFSTSNYDLFSMLSNENKKTHTLIIR